MALGLRNISVLLVPLVFSSVSSFVAIVAHAQTPGLAVVSGVVRDPEGTPIPGVTVTAARATGAGPAAENASIAITDDKGDFRFPGLRPGSYLLEAILDGFQPVNSKVDLVTGQSVVLRLQLVPAFTDTVTVVAEGERTSEVAILESRRQSGVVSDIISSEEIRKTPDSNAASVVERLTGVTLLGNKYVFIRGLGERYSNTTINGATLPTTETEKRVVPLDLFPAKLLDTVNVVKTYTPDKPGDFGSGVVEMTTTEFPDTATFKVTVGAGHNSSATGRAFRRYAGGLDRVGNGGQPLPSTIPATVLKRRSALDPSGFTTAEFEAFGEALAGEWTGRAEGSAAPATDFSLTYGNTFGRLGVVVSAVSNHGYEEIDEQQRFFGIDSGGRLTPRNDYAMTTWREKVTAGFVGNVSMRLTDRNRLHFRSMLTRDASAEDRFQEGLNTNSGGWIRDYRDRYLLEEVLTMRLAGEHNLSGPGIGSLIEWNLSHSSATSESDLRENLYRESSTGVYALQAGYPESGKIEYFDLDDRIEQGGLSYSAFFAGGSGRWSGTIKGGLDRSNRTRDFGARRFRFATANQLQFDLTLPPDEIFTPDNIRPNGFEIREITGVNDAYDAEHTVDAGYVMTDTSFGRWRLIGGARFEDSSLRVTTFNPFDVANETAAVREDRDVLPSLNLVWAYAPRSNLRVAWGRSLNRPEFRELSPFSFVEITGGRAVVGNPDLEQAMIDSLDLRWEMFPAQAEVLAVSVFYKTIDRPIERIIQPTTELRTSYVNADSATLHGLELELRRSLASITPWLRRWSVNLNYSYVSSDVRVPEQQLSVVTSLDRPLAGQSDQAGNLALQFYEPNRGSMIRLLGSHSGRRLTDVGAYGLPDIFEGSFTSIDAVYSQELRFLARGLEMKLSATNLLGATREFLQGDQVQRRYEPGRTVGLGLSFSPF